MAISELTEQDTPQDMKAYAEQVVQEVEAERAGEQPQTKSDAEIITSTAGKAKPEPKETPAETETGSDTALEGETTAEVEDQGETTGREWLDDDLKAEIASYGIEESEIADFDSREELERALRFFDRSALDAGRKAMAESEVEPGETPRGKNGRFLPKDHEVEEEEKPKAASPATRDGRYEIALDPDVYDEDIIGEFTRLRDHYEDRLEALESRFQDADARAEEKHFDNLVDKLGHADMFGKTDGETTQQLQRRKDLMVAVKAQMIGLERLGRPTELTESLVNRVARMVFPEELGKKDLKQRTRKIAKQSNGRLGGGATRPQDPREDPRDEADRLYRELSRAS